MQTNEHRDRLQPEAPALPAPPPRGAWRTATPLLGIGGRLGLGLAAVAAVLVGDEVLSTRTTREALEAVRVMQNEHEPLAASANAVLERLVAYDRIGQRISCERARRPTSSAITSAGDSLEDAVDQLLRASHAAPASRHGVARTARATDAATSRTRAPWPSAPRSARSGLDAAPRRLDRVYQLHRLRGRRRRRHQRHAGRTARRSLSELETAIDAVRGQRRHQALTQRRGELRRAARAERAGAAGFPGPRLARPRARGLRRCGAPAPGDRALRCDQRPGVARLLEDSAALTGGVQEQLQKPARLGLITGRAARRQRRRGRRAARCTPARSPCSGCWLLVSVLLTVSISLPVRRLTRHSAARGRR